MSKDIKNKTLACPCGSIKPASHCCLPLIDGRTLAQSAEQLMRSRYSAFALGYEKYILSSWHSSSRPNSLKLEKNLQWSGLKVLTRSAEKNNVAYVEFVAEFNNDGEVGQLHERSRFLFEAGQWFYVEGEQIESATLHHFRPPGRNDPCHCGSGKKYKKCCALKSQ